MIGFGSTLRRIQLLHVVVSALFLLVTFAASLEPNELNDDSSAKDEVNSTSARWTTETISSHTGFRHYFRHEFESLTSQAAMLGDYHPDEESRLKLQLKALKIELAYTRNLRRIRSESVKNITNITASATCDDNRKKQSLASEVLNKMKKAFSKAGKAALPSKGDIPVKMQIHHGYDFDWIDENGSFGLYDELKCDDHALAQNKRLYSDDDWHSLWHFFQEAALYPYPIPEPSKRLYYTAYSHGKGRGNFASRNIKQGEMIYNGYKNAAFFQEGESFKRFVSLLSREAACDVLEWSFMQDLTNDGNAVLCLDMDGGALFNDGFPYQNMEYKEKTSLNKFATRDIHKGEEITEKYDEFFKTEIDI